MVRHVMSHDDGMRVCARMCAHGGYAAERRRGVHVGCAGTEWGSEGSTGQSLLGANICKGSMRCAGAETLAGCDVCDKEKVRNW